MNEERKEHSTWNNEVHNISVATLTSVNDVRPRVFGDNLQIPPKFLAKSMPSPASVYMCNVMEANGVDTNGTRIALPGIVNSSSRLASRTAFDMAAREATALGPVLDAFTQGYPRNLARRRRWAKLSAVTRSHSSLQGRRLRTSTKTNTQFFRQRQLVGETLAP